MLCDNFSTLFLCKSKNNTRFSDLHKCDMLFIYAKIAKKTANMKHVDTSQLLLLKTIYTANEFQ